MIITDEQLTTWLKRLVNIPSVTPEQAGARAGALGEARLAAAVAAWFRDFGGDVYTEDVLPGRPNVYGIWCGTSQRWAALDVHMDTVGVEQMSGDPFGGELRGCGLGPGTYAARVASPRLVRARHLAIWEVYSPCRRGSAPRQTSPRG
jgi:acetylornithine deacetylase/succinyl-diaminopimelate desuccinylase-like protein